MRGSETAADVLVLALWSALWFVLGVSWAIYRAVTWQERMRLWAHSLPQPTFGLRDGGMGQDGSAGGPEGVRAPAAPLAYRAVEGVGQE